MFDIGRQYAESRTTAKFLASYMYEHNIGAMRGENGDYVLRIRSKFYPERLSCYDCLREIFEEAVVLEIRESGKEEFVFHPRCCDIEIEEREVIYLKV
ncbi:hypothetical protein CL616_04315 [archaeon]|nr:hypothetical protein [archaeon]|tara:strand:+ start:35 stop:328 length:294 start_codon:yes stop_codon:yes gene_type:complete